MEAAAGDGAAEKEPAEGDALAADDKRDLAVAWLGRGIAEVALGQRQRALGSFEKASELRTGLWELPGR